MKGPEVNPENHQQIYEYYTHVEPNERLINAVHRVAGRVYRPHVRLADKAEEAIAERLDEHDRFIIASNHLNIADQFPISALMRQLEVLRPLEGHTFVLAKSGYFGKRYLKPALDATGTVPVFRPQDVQHNSRLQVEASRSLIDASVARMVDGWNILIFPEGTRNKGDPTKLGRIEGGVGRIASRASEQVGVSILPIALWYGEGEEHHYMRPDVFIDNPIEGPFGTKRDVVRRLGSALQQSVQRVTELSETNTRRH